MNIVRLIVVGFLACLLAACGGGGGGSLIVETTVPPIVIPVTPTAPAVAVFRTVPVRAGLTQRVVQGQKGVELHSFLVAEVPPPSCRITRLVFRDTAGTLWQYLDTRYGFRFTVNGAALTTPAGDGPAIRMLDGASVEVVFPTGWTPPANSVYAYSLVADLATTAPFSGFQLGLQSYEDTCSGGHLINFAGGAASLVTERIGRLGPQVESISPQFQSGSIGTMVQATATYVCVSPPANTANCFVPYLEVLVFNGTAPQIVFGSLSFPMTLVPGFQNKYTFPVNALLGPGTTLPFTVRTTIAVGIAAGLQLDAMPTSLSGDLFYLNHRSSNACNTFVPPSSCKG